MKVTIEIWFMLKIKAIRNTGKGACIPMQLFKQKKNKSWHLAIDQKRKIENQEKIEEEEEEEENWGEKKIKYGS